MVDFVPNIGPERNLVEKTKDALEHQGRGGGQEEEAFEQKEKEDRFGKRSGKDHLEAIFDKKNAWQKNVDVKVEDVDRVKFLGVNYKTDPSLLKIRIFLFDGSVIDTAFILIARPLALKLKNLTTSAFIDVNMLTRESLLKVIVPTDEAHADDEITRVTYGDSEKSLSKKLKDFIGKRTWAEKMGLKDSLNGEVRLEILAIYATVLLLGLFFVFGGLYLLM